MITNIRSELKGEVGSLEPIDDDIDFGLVPVDEIKSSEKINIGRAKSLVVKINSDGSWLNPILVEKKYKVVMDGNHRLWAAQQLNCRRVPCLLLNYGNRYLSLNRWAGDEVIRPEDVISAGLSGKLLDYKTTRHVLTKDIISPPYDLAELR